MSGSTKSLLFKARPLESGYNRIVAPGERGLKYLEFGRLLLSAGEQFADSSGDREVCLTILSGRATVIVSSDSSPESSRVTFAEVGERENVFAGNPAMVYVPRGSQFQVQSHSESLDVAVFYCVARRDAVPFRKDGADLTLQTFGTANWTRDACIELGDADDVDRLLVGETYNRPGNWSSYPPHKHDATNPPAEEPYEEIYFFLVNPPQGFGIQRVYTAPDASDPLNEVYVVENGDAVAIPRGYHPVAAGAGYQLYYLWALAGENRRFGSWSDDPEHTWIRDLENQGG